MNTEETIFNMDDTASMCAGCGAISQPQEVFCDECGQPCYAIPTRLAERIVTEFALLAAELEYATDILEEIAGIDADLVKRVQGQIAWDGIEDEQEMAAAFNWGATGEA